LILAITSAAGKVAPETPVPVGGRVFVPLSQLPFETDDLGNAVPLSDDLSGAQPLDIAPMCGSSGSTTQAPATTQAPTNDNPICNVCGVDAGNRIVNGQAAADGSIPWQVLLYMQFSGGWSTCGGTLVGSKTVVTAAHCIQGASQVIVIPGTNSRNSGTQISVTGAGIIPHENYNSNTLENDFGLVILPSDVTFSNDIAPACLPADLTSSFNGVAGVISGWGKTCDSCDTATDLQVTDTTIKTGSECTPWGTYSWWNDAMNICVYTETNGVVANSCQGDSGGPLTIVGTGGKVTLVGATSFGSTTGCAIQGIANVYTRTQLYLSNGWIASKAGTDFCQV